MKIRNKLEDVSLHVGKITTALYIIRCEGVDWIEIFQDRAQARGPNKMGTSQLLSGFLRSTVPCVIS